MNIVSLQSETIAVYAFLQADNSAPWNGFDVIEGVSHGFDSCLNKVRNLNFSVFIKNLGYIETFKHGFQVI